MPSWSRNGKTVENKYKGADLTRKILTGKTGDLGRSIQTDRSRTGAGRATVWTNPSKFTRSDRIYAAVHNEGLMAGRGKGFKMPKRQFMGESPTLNKLIIQELQRKLAEMAKNL
jgi:phage gpG-like protein